jgi:glycosidase
VSDIKSYFAQVDSIYPAGTYPLQFTSNHDENSWNGTVYERLGDAVKAFAALSFTIPGMPLIYSGQEVGLDKRLEFFEKDEINWENSTEMTDFYSALINLKQENPALWNGTPGGWIEFFETSSPEKLLAFKREKDDNSIVVIMNLSDEILEGTVDFDELGNFSNYFSGEEVELNENEMFNLNPWEYLVLVNN